MCHKLGRVVALLTILTFFVVLLQYQKKGGIDRPHPLTSRRRPATTNYVINNLVCGESVRKEGVRLISLITSHPGNGQLRDKLRTLLPTSELGKLGMRRLFLLGTLDWGGRRRDESLNKTKYNWVSRSEIEREGREHGDLVVGDFLESYHNLTLKHVMGLEWVDRFCPQATFVLKQDDDIIVDYFQLDVLLGQPPFASALEDKGRILGKVLDHQTVIRDPSSKWFVPKEVYPSDTFPSFVSGWAYITTPKVVKALLVVAQNLEYFWIDDVHVTGTLREAAGISLLDLTEYFTTFKGQLECCVATPEKKLSVLQEEDEKRRPFWCDFVVGPPNDDQVLMELFHRHATFCHTTKLCGRRRGRQRLERSCVITPHMIVNRFLGQSQNSSISRLQKGVWKPLARNYG